MNAELLSLIFFISLHKGWSGNHVLYNLALIRQEPLQKGQLNCTIRGGNCLGKACSLL